MILALAILLAPAHARQRGPASTTPEALADAKHYDIQLELQPESYRLKAAVTIDFAALQSVSSLTLELNGNCSMRQVFDGQDRELIFTQDDYDTFTVKVELREAVPPGEGFRLRFVYEGMFEKRGLGARGPLSQTYAVISPEGTYLPYAAKWLPVYRFLVDRATVQTTVTLPLGYSAVGPGEQLSSRIEGISEVFTSLCNLPVLPASVTAGRFFPKLVEHADLRANFMVEEEDLEACDKIHGVLLPYYHYFSEKVGPFLWGNTLTVVEVADTNDYLPGAPGVLYVPRSLFKAIRPDGLLLAQKLAYQWWGHALPVASPEDAWLPNALSLYAPIPYLETDVGADAVREAIGELQVLALQGEGRSAVQNAWRLGYMGDDYQSLAGGKGAWVLHMLRRMLGEVPFVRLLSLWHAGAGQAAPTQPDFRRTVNEVAGRDLSWFFTQWIDSIGVPQFDIEYIILKTRTGFRVAGTVRQDKDLFRMPVDLAIETKGKTVRQEVLVEGKRSDFRVDLDTQPVRVVVDPDSGVLRDSPDLKVAVHISRGRRYFERDQLVEAIEQFDEALQLNPRKSLASFYLGETLYEQWNIQSAANAFRDALNGDLDPRWVEVWSYIYLGKIFDILGQRDRAVAEYTKAVNTKNDHEGAQAEAEKYLKEPFTRQRTVMNP